MCGLAGYIGKKVINQNIIDRTSKLMQNRGPDHQGFKSFSKEGINIYLLHSRLSIIDIDIRSNQPFSLGGCTLVFNGEIYNYLEQKSKLEKLGFKFITNSDTEVLLKSYLKYGKNCVDHFEGMWAFAIWDSRKNEIFLSRDRFAEKPLYLMKTSNGIFFGSEIKFISTLSGTSLSINTDHIQRYLIYGYRSLYKTKETYFSHISELKFASNATIDLNLNVQEKRYWYPNRSVVNMSRDEAIDGTRERLFESVRLRLRADVPLAFCLSGGVDSASLASIAAKVHNYNVTTFSIIDPDKRYNELNNIKSTIRDLDCDHHLIDLKYNNMLERLIKLVQYHDSPIATITYVVHSLLSEEIHNLGFKVSISGTSADELFTGYYDHFNLHLYEMRNHPCYNELLADWKKHISKYVRNPFLKNHRLYFEDPTHRDHNYLNSDEFNKFLIEPINLKITESSYNPSLLRNRMLNELFHEATPVILHEDDLNSMMRSIENRSPFLDTELFNYAYSIPNEYLINNGFGKYILRESVKGILNEKVRLDRRKKGFNASINSIIDLKNSETIDFILEDGPIYEMVFKSKIESLIKKDYYENSYKKFLFNFLNAKIFMEQF